MSYCDFVQYTGQAAGAEQKDLWSFAETSCHLKTQQNQLCKHLGKCSKKQSIFRLKKNAWCSDSAFIAIPLSFAALIHLQRVTLPCLELTFVLNHSLAESSTVCANLFYKRHLLEDLSKQKDASLLGRG